MSGNNNDVSSVQVITECPVPADLWNKNQLIRIKILMNSKHDLKETMPWIDGIF